MSVSYGVVMTKPKYSDPIISQIIDSLDQEGALTTTEIISEVKKTTISEIDEKEITKVLNGLKDSNAISSRMLGKLTFWYPLQKSETSKIKKVLIVEDDKNINKLMKLSIGSNYEVKEGYDGDEALKLINEFHPDLIILDLMLPGTNGLEICKKVKSSNETKDIIIIIVSAADTAINRFFGIKNGADYYIKKPFDPEELRILTEIFLKKDGKKFDPLIDIPDVKRLINNLNSTLKSSTGIEFTKVDIEGLPEYKVDYGKKEAVFIIRLVSQMLQDKIREMNLEFKDANANLSYLGEDSFLVVANKGISERFIKEVESDFARAARFIRQKHKITGDLFEKIRRGKVEGITGQTFSLRIEHYQINVEAFKRQFVEFNNIFVKSEKELEDATETNIRAIKKYTLDQIRELFENSKIELSVSEIGGNIKLTASRVRPKNQEK